MAYGFGCDDRVMVHLKNMDINLQELHRWVHQYTGLASFRGLLGCYVDIKDVRSYVKKCVERYHEIRETRGQPKDMRSYIPPQLYWFDKIANDIYNNGGIIENLTRSYNNRFGLVRAEIALAQNFFHREKVVCTADVGTNIRQDYKQIPFKTVKDFTDYSYFGG